MSNKPMTLADAREWFTEEQLVAMKEDGFEQSAEMVRALLAATAEGPATHNAPTGAGDYDIICEGCGEPVAEPHSWSECTDGLRKRLLAALDALVGDDRARDVERETCATIALDIVVGNTELPTHSAQESKEWRRCAEFIYDEIRGRV
jgi:predicted Fe-S protein YdhL (DUF1289 family)